MKFGFPGRPLSKVPNTPLLCASILIANSHNGRRDELSLVGRTELNRRLSGVSQLFVGSVREFSDFKKNTLFTCFEQSCQKNVKNVWHKFSAQSFKIGLQLHSVIRTVNVEFSSSVLSSLICTVRLCWVGLVSKTVRTFFMF